MRRLLVTAAISGCLTGCGSTASEPAPIGTSSTRLAGPGGLTWTNVGFGINAATLGGGPNALVVYGGYTATDVDSESLAVQYVKAQLGSLGVGHLFAVRGPEDAGYAAREIGNSRLAAQLAAMATGLDFVAVVAHSSGAFVADELFTEASAQVLSRIVYFDLDGGSWALTSTLVGQMRGVYFCNARDPVAGESENASAIVSLHGDFPASHLFTVDASGSGCHVGAGWCLHDTLITSRPHDPATYDLNDDYTDFTGAGRHVVVSQMQQAMADGVLPGGAMGPVDGGAGEDAGAGNDAGAGDGGGSDGGTADAPSGACSLGGQSYATNTCTETLQCDAGAWVERTTDPSDCNSAVLPGGACLTDTGTVVPQNTCTTTLQCDDGVWVDRATDPAACL